VNRWEYNARDCLATYAVWERITPHLDDMTRRIYEAEMGLQGVALGIQMRGIRIDLPERNRVVKGLLAECDVWGKEIETVAGTSLIGPKGSISAQRMANFLYETCHLTPQLHEGKITTRAEVLERIIKGAVPSKATVLSERKFDLQRAKTGAELALRIRDQRKQCSLLKTGLEDGRMRCTFVVGGTESFRFSSHKACTGRGTNLQNIDKRLRSVFIPDPGFTMVQMDQERAESMVVAYCSGDGGYIQAHLYGNTHVTVARIAWPDLGWSNDPKEDRALAEGKLGRHTMYFLAKKIQHGLNYLLTPHGMARNLGLKVVECERIYDQYFTAFPGILEWHKTVIKELKETGKVIYPGGYSREFFGRLSDTGTHREAISSIPQSIIAWTNHIVWTRMYKELEGEDLQVLGHGHDSVLFQMGPMTANGNRLMGDAIKRIQHVPWTINGREMVIKWDIKVGRNWQEVS